MINDEIAKEEIKLFLDLMGSNKNNPMGFILAKRMQDVEERKTIIHLSKPYAPRERVSFFYVEIFGLENTHNSLIVTRGDARTGMYYNRDCTLNPKSLAAFEQHVIPEEDFRKKKVYIKREGAGF